jgi:hypothetical protein
MHSGEANASMRQTGVVLSKVPLSSDLSWRGTDGPESAGQVGAGTDGITPNRQCFPFSHLVLLTQGQRERGLRSKGFFVAGEWLSRPGNIIRSGPSCDAERSRPEDREEPSAREGISSMPRLPRFVRLGLPHHVTQRETRSGFAVNAVTRYELHAQSGAISPARYLFASLSRL